MVARYSGGHGIRGAGSGGFTVWKHALRIATSRDRCSYHAEKRLLQTATEIQNNFNPSHQYFQVLCAVHVTSE